MGSASGCLRPEIRGLHPATDRNGNPARGWPERGAELEWIAGPPRINGAGPPTLHTSSGSAGLPTFTDTAPCAAVVTDPRQIIIAFWLLGMGVEAGYLTGLRASGEAGSPCFEVAYVAGIYLLAVFNIETPAYRALGEN